MAIRVTTTGQTTFVKKVVIGTPVRSVTGTGASFTTLNDVTITNATQNQIITFDSSTQRFINNDSATLVNLTLSGNVKSNLVPSQDSTFDLGDSAFKWKDLYLSGGTIHLGGLLLKDSGTQFSVSDSAGTSVDFDLSGSTSQIRGMFSGSGDLTYNSSTGVFEFDVEQVYTKANFDSDFDDALDSAALGGTGLTFNSSTNTLDITNTGVTAATYGSSTLIPQIAVNAQGQITSASNVTVAGVSSTSFDSASGIFTINTADGGVFNSKIADSSFTSSRARDVFSAVDAGGDGSFAYDSALGKFTYTGPSASEVRAHLSGGTGITYNSSTGVITTTDGDIVHDNLSGFVANEHIDHSGVSITAGDGLKGGGTIASTRDLAIDSAELLALYEASLRHDNLSGFVADEHVAHSGVSIVAGKGLSGGGTIASSRTIDIDSSNVRGMFSGGTGITYNSGTGEFTTTDGDIVHDNLSGFVANEHINHTSVSITAGAGLTGGGDISSTRTINVVGGKGITANADDIQVDSANLVILARNALSGSNGITYSTSTGDIRAPQPLDSAANPTFNQLRGPATFVIDPAAIGDSTGTVRILGNLTVEGTTTTINSVDVSINEKTFTIADSAADSADLSGAGIFWGGSSITANKPSFQYNHASERFDANRTINADAFIGVGSGLTSLSGSNISSGTVAAARIDNLNASKINAGVFDSARIPAIQVNANRITSGTIDSARIPAIQINANRITSGTIDSARLPDLATSDITSGVLDSARVPAIQIDANRITSGTIDNARISLDANEIPSLATSKITSGVFDSARVPVMSIGAGNVTSGTLDSARVPAIQIDGNRITSGTVAAARIDNLNASKINAGVFDSARVPILAIGAGNVTSGTFADARIPNLAASKITSGSFGNDISFDSAGGILFDLSDKALEFGPSYKISGLKTTDSAIIGGDGSTGGVTISDGLVDIRSNTGHVSKVKFYCEVSNAHFQTLQAQPHSVGSSAVIVLPAASGTLLNTDGSGASLTSLNASELSSGTVPSARLSLSASDIPNLAASKITSGSFDDARIPNLAASKITSGTFDSARLPDLATSDITSGTLDSARLPAGISFGASGGSITVQEEGSSLSTGATTLNFVGSAVTASGTGTTKTITITQAAGGTDSSTVSSIITADVDNAFVDALNVNAATVTATANNSTNETVYLTFVDGATGEQGIETDTSLTYNPSTNILTLGTGGDALTLDDAGLIIASGNTLRLRSASGVLLQHDDATKLQTTSSGVDVEGSITVGSGDTFVLDGSESTTSSTSQTALVTVAKATYGAAKFLVTAVSSSERHITEIYATHDGTTGVATEYGTVTTNGILATYDVDINGDNFRLLATPASSTSTTFKVVQTLIEA